MLSIGSMEVLCHNKMVIWRSAASNARSAEEVAKISTTLRLTTKMIRRVKSLKLVTPKRNSKSSKSKKKRSKS